MLAPKLRLIQGDLSETCEQLAVGEIVQIADPLNPQRPLRYAIVQSITSRKQNAYTVFDTDARLIIPRVEQRHLARISKTNQRFWQAFLERHLTTALGKQKCVYRKATHVIDSVYFDEDWKLWVQRLRRRGLDQKESCLLREIKLTGSI